MGQKLSVSTCIMVPFYNDSKSLAWLINAIREILGDAYFNDINFLLVNDGSNDDMDPKIGSFYPNVELLNLSCNLGHQRAIAVGLSYLAMEKNYERVIVMDADGEDRPEDIKRLIQMADDNPGNIIFAQRLKRSENVVFRIFYACYKMIFRLLTGHAISFGNFCLLPKQAVKRIVYRSEIWNHFAGGVVRARLAYKTISTKRGKRQYGASKMNFTALILHGLSAISVHLDVVAVRILITTFLLMIMSFVGILFVLARKLFTSLAIPGWASTVTIGLSNVLMQSFFISLFLIFIVLNYRIHQSFIPAVHYKNFIEK